MLVQALQADPTADPWAPFGAATALARAGIRVLPIAPGSKTPAMVGGFRHGARSATLDVEAIRDAWLSEPAANVATAPDGAWVVLDIDVRNGGSLERAEALGLDVSGYRERSGGGGHHIPLRMPPGVRATRSAVLGPGIELIAKGRYAVSPASRLAGGGRYQPEAGRSIWRWAAIPAGWEHLHRITESGPRTAAPAVTADDERGADDVVRRLLQSAYADDVRGVLADGQGRFSSRSEADFALALAASHHLRDHPRREQVVAALLHQHSRKARDHADPGSYIARTAFAALAGRDQRDADRLACVRERLLAGLPDHTAQGPSPNTVTVGTSPGITPKDAVIRWLATVLPGSEEDRGDGWCRIPVSDIASVLGCDRRTVTRALVSLEADGTVERRIECHRHDGAPRRDSLARLTWTTERTSTREHNSKPDR